MEKDMTCIITERREPVAVMDYVRYLRNTATSCKKHSGRARSARKPSHH